MERSVFGGQFSSNHPHNPRRAGVSLGARWQRSAVSLALLVALALVAGLAHAGGSFQLTTKEVNEVSGGWHLFVKIELGKPPSMAHVPLKFLFTKTVVYDRALVDNSKEPVLVRTPMQNQQPMVESLDVDFSNGMGKVFKGTRFDFSLTRTRGYEAGEYKVQVRTTDGSDVGSPTTLVLKGDNPPVDRRTITFNAKEPAIRKIEGVDGGAKGPADQPESAATPDVEAQGTPPPFVPSSAFDKTPEEQLRDHPKGCGCAIPGADPAGSLGLLVAFAGLGLAAARRRRA